MDVRATSQADPENRLCPHLRPNALHHGPILAPLHRMAQISWGYTLSDLEATSSPHFSLGRSSLPAHDWFAPQQLGICIPRAANRADRVSFRRYATKEISSILGRLTWILPGVVIAMILGRYLLQRRYTSRQVVSI